MSTENNYFRKVVILCAFLLFPLFVCYSAGVNEARTQYYGKSGREKPNDFDPGWNVARIFGDILDEFHNFALFEKGYIYVDKDGRFYTVCLFENGVLKRKLVLSGSAMGDFSFSIYGDKIYIGRYLLGFTVDINTAQVSSAFNSRYSGRNAAIYVYVFPFDGKDIVYTYTIDYGK